MDELAQMPWAFLGNLGAGGLLAFVMIMLFRGTLATPKQQQMWADQNAYLQQVVKDQTTTITELTESVKVVEQMAPLVEKTMAAINERANRSGDGL